ncbi:MAG: potassium-transporting ATPase subunit KdpA, partial [Anaerolineae bacterium]
MTIAGLIQLGAYMVVLLLCVKPLGTYMAAVYEGRSFVNRVFGGAERLLYRLIGTREDTEMNWKTYALAFLIFNFFGMLVVYLLQRVQTGLPLNQGSAFLATPMTADSAFNTAVSFATNTNWQGYGGETTMTYLTQMLGLTVQNFVSAASGMAVLVALIRGFSRRTTQVIGNFWVDLVRSTLYILLPLSIVLA